MRGFQQSISVRPSLGKLVEALHIGADNALPRGWWPLRRSTSSGETNCLFALNLASSVDGKGPQWGGCSRYEHDIDGFDKDDPKAVALDRAFDAAQREINVRLRTKCDVYSGTACDSDDWHERVLELQAALELYLLDLERCDQKAAELAQKEGAIVTRKRKKAEEEGKVPVSYPRLRVGVKKEAKFGVFHVTRLEIRERLASPGAPADTFNHPLLFARVGFSWTAVGPDGEVHSGGHHFEEEYDVEGIGDIFDRPRCFQPGQKLPSSWALDPLLVHRHSTDTLGGNLLIARSIITLTPHAEVLSLTGLFEHMVSDWREPPQQELRSLTIGPHSPLTHIPLRLDYPAFSSLKKLRICDLPTYGYGDISGDEPTIRYLEKLQWSEAGKCLE